MNDTYEFYDEETYGYRTNAARDTYYAFALVDGNGNLVDSTGSPIDLSDSDDVTNLQSALLKRYHSNKETGLSASAVVKYNQPIDGTDTNGAGDDWVFYDVDGNEIKEGASLPTGVKIALVPFKETLVTDDSDPDNPYTYLIPQGATGPLINDDTLVGDLTSRDRVYNDIFGKDAGVLDTYFKITDYAYNTSYAKEFDRSTTYNGAYDTEHPFKHGDNMSAYRDSDGDTVFYTPKGTPKISGGGGRITGVYVYDLDNPGVIINKALEVEAKLDATKNMWGRVLGLTDPDIMGTEDDGKGSCLV